MLLISIGAIGFLWSDVRQQQDTLSDVRSDNVQWTVGQVMVEYQSLMAALDEAIESDGSSETLDAVRRSFDILYNRMDILEYGRLYNHLLEHPDYAAGFTAVRAAIKAATPLIDGPDEALTGALPALETRFGQLEPDVRRFILEGVQIFALHSTQLREGLTRTMDRVAWLTAAMLAVLIGLTVGLLRESRLAENRLIAQKRTLARLDTILSTSLDGIIVADPDGRIVEFNGAAENLFGLAAGEARDRRLRDLLRPGADPWHAVTLVGAGIVEMDAAHCSGHQFPVEMNVEAVEIDDEPLLVAFIRDITIRKAAEMELIEARDRALAGERAKADFVAVMSHELRTPLNGILGMLALLRATPLDPQQADYVSKMGTSGQILRASVDDVLDISRAEAGKMHVAPAPTALEPLLRSVAESQVGAASARGNQIRFQALTDLPEHILVDAARLRQILVNLIGNAIKFTENGEIALEAELLADQSGREVLELRVIDNGIGIASQDLPRIFDDFETLDASFARKHSGAGLGLSIVRRIVAAMDGAVDVTSEPDVGSLFIVALPVTRALPAAALASRPAVRGAPSSTRPRRVLVIEDNEVNRAVLCGLLERRGCLVAEAPSATLGIAAAARQRFDLILMDLSMPGMDGVRAARRIRAGGASACTPIHAVTAHAGFGDRHGDAAAVFNSVLTKPLLPEQIDMLLAEKPARVVGHSGASADLDTAHLDMLLDDLGPEVLLKLLDRFAEEAASETRCLVTNTDGPAPDTIAERAHRLAGAAASFGADRMAACLENIQAAIDAGADTTPLVATLAEDWRRTSEALDGWRAGILKDQAS